MRMTCSGYCNYFAIMGWRNWLLRLNNRKKSSSSKSNWLFGLGNLHGGLDQVNIRDYAYED